MTEANVSELLELPESQLLELLGDQLLGTGRGAGPADRGERRRFADSWLSRWFEEHRESVCSSPAVVGLLSEDGRSQAEDAAVLIDAVAAMLNKPVVATVAVILAKRGIGRLCAA